MRPMTPQSRLRPSNPWLSTALSVVAALVLLASGSAFAQKIDYRHKDFTQLAPTPSLAELSAYQGRLFDDQTSQSRAISAEVGPDSYVCPLAFQDAARTSSNGEQSVTAVVAYRNCPFELDFVAAETWVRLREPLTIEIDEVRDGIAYTSTRAAVPFIAGRSAEPFAAPTAVGVTWRFTRSGVRFSTLAGDFVSGRSGATISFTSNGVRFNGFSTIPRRAGVSPSTNGWSRAAMQAVQDRLTRLGYDPGPVDGLWGSRTRDAILAFQRRAGLDASGTLDSVTLDELGI